MGEVQLPARIRWTEVPTVEGQRFFETSGPGWYARIVDDAAAGHWEARVTFDAGGERVWRGSAQAPCQCWVRRQVKSKVA